VLQKEDYWSRRAGQKHRRVVRGQAMPMLVMGEGASILALEKPTDPNRTGGVFLKKKRGGERQTGKQQKGKKPRPL